MPTSLSKGHGIEDRLKAEDVIADFRLGSGRMWLVWFPALPGLRLDTHMPSGALIPPCSVSLVAKVIAHGDTQAEAIATMQQALTVGTLHGITTQARPAIMADPVFQAGGADAKHLPRLLPHLTKAAR